MGGHLVVMLDNVVLREVAGRSYAASKPIAEGIELVQRLWGEGVTRITAATSGNPEEAHHFLKVNQIPFDQVHHSTQGEIRQIKRLRADGPVWLVLTGDPDTSMWCYERAQPSLCLFHPQFTEPAPERLKSWHELVSGRGGPLNGQA